MPAFLATQITGHHAWSLEALIDNGFLIQSGLGTRR